VKGFGRRLSERLGKETATRETLERLRNRQGRENRKVHAEDSLGWSYFKRRTRGMVWACMPFSAMLLIQKPDRTTFDFLFVLFVWLICLFLLRNSLYDFFVKIRGGGRR
jgi:hypothetical protein